MAARRRWLQFSLRGFFVLVTAFAVWLGVIVNRAREQREAVKAIEALGGAAVYDRQQEIPAGVFTSFPPAASPPPGPAWLRRIVGDDFFQNVSRVDFGSPIAPTEIELSKAIPCLKQLRTLKRIRVFALRDMGHQQKLKNELPHCNLELYYVDNSPSPMPARMLDR